MNILQGSGVSAGIAIGELHVLQEQAIQITSEKVRDTVAELKRYEEAKRQAQLQLAGLYKQALQQVGEDDAAVFNIHQMMLDDADFNEMIQNRIESESRNAEYAVDVCAKEFSNMFAQMDDDYMRARAADVIDISTRVINVLQKKQDTSVGFDRPIILLAVDLTPSQTIQLDKKNILAFVTKQGSQNSHTAILARTLGIPAIASIGQLLDDYSAGAHIALDGATGELVVDADAATLERFSQKAQQQREEKIRRESYLDKPAITKDGKRILTYANAGNLSDLEHVVANGAEGIGLFRTEFLYLEGNEYPSEERQFSVYKSVVEAMGDKLVVFRTCDIGADKKADYFGLAHEENPALGLRAIRICLQRPDMFRDQLRALLRASAFGNLAIMFPMIISKDEILRSKAILEHVKAELVEQNIAFSDSIEFGIMIETPAAAIMSDDLAQEVDFFSVGTNDLSQYTLAIDRQNDCLGEFFDPHHPAMLELIRMSAKNAHKHGIWIGICGELGADLELTEQFIEMGIDELSVVPPAILPLREKICSL